MIDLDRIYTAAIGTAIGWSFFEAALWTVKKVVRLWGDAEPHKLPAPPWLEPPDDPPEEFFHGPAPFEQMMAEAHGQTPVNTFTLPPGVGLLLSLHAQAKAIHDEIEEIEAAQREKDRLN